MSSSSSSPQFSATPGKTRGNLAELERLPREMARWQKAQQQLVGGRHAPALTSYRDLTKRFPNVPQLWFELGIAAGADLDFPLAGHALNRAAELAPDDTHLLILIGQQFHRLRQRDQARSSFERAVAANPASAQARVTLADWYERERRMDDAWECVQASLEKHPQDAQARQFRAFLLHRKGQNELAETELRDLIKSGPAQPQVKYSSRQLLGVVLDALGNYAEALKWLHEAKAQLRQLANAASLEQDYDRADRHRRELLASLTPQLIQRWRSESIAPPLRLALLGGHPRSGTTLLEQILGAHPETLAFDESEAFVQEVLTPILPAQSTRGMTLDSLNSLSAGWRTDLRRRYLKSLLRETADDPGARMLVDKNPSPTTSLPLWLRIFPELKVIIALRDPRDIVISCFFQNLTLTTVNVNFLSLERTARHYSDLMDVWLRMRELGNFDWLETRYEDVVNNLEGEGRRVMEFLGLSWQPNQANFHEKARQKVLFAPTYDSVTRPIHKGAVGRWQHYAEAMAPIQERLAPYCRAFGYTV